MNLTQLLLTGFGAAVLGAIIASGAEIGQKYLVTTKKQTQSAVLINLYFFLALISIVLALTLNQFTLNATSILLAAISASVQALGVYLTLKAYAIEDFSLTLPFLYLTSIFIIPVEWLLFRDSPTILALFGIGAIIGGAFYLSRVENKKGAWKFSLGSRLMILVALLYCVAGPLDKLGLQQSTSVGYLTWLYVFTGVWLVIWGWLLAKKSLVKNEVVKSFKNYWPLFLIIGLIIVISGWLMFNAYSTILVNYVISIKRAAFLIPILLGPLIFKEKNLLKRLPGVLLMLAGAIIIILFG
ncbi:MAG: EamA family transporter [Candidatus Komeilibacteria bacterium]|nr:EamA family transporter [Candidatus Komeilibacteria bacterium]